MTLGMMGRRMRARAVLYQYILNRSPFARQEAAKGLRDPGLVLNRRMTAIQTLMSGFLQMSYLTLGPAGSVVVLGEDEFSQNSREPSLINKAKSPVLPKKFRNFQPLLIVRELPFASKQNGQLRRFIAE